jgi:DNA modification methylase
MENLTWKNDRRKVSDLIPWTGNPRKISEKQAAELRKSLERFNLVETPVVNTDGTVIGGHQRLKILAILGRENEMIDVRVPSRELTLDEMIELNLRLNKNTAEWDGEKLLGLDLEKLLDVGFDRKTLNALAPEDPDQYKNEKALPKMAREVPAMSKPGHVYTLGKHRLMCGDATNFEDARALLAGNLADMIFTDPPYGVNATGAGGKALHGDLSFTIIPFAFDTIDNFLKPGAAVYVCGGGFNIPLYYKLFEKHWRMMPHPIIWVKESFVLRRSHYHSQFEILFYGWKSGAAGKWCGDRKQSDVWNISREKHFEHPTIKPVELVARAIKNSTNPGDIVVDFFTGSGATLLAAEQTGRVFYGMEIDPHYCDLIVRRFCEFTGLQPSMVYDTAQEFKRVEETAATLDDANPLLAESSQTESVAENATPGKTTK